MTKLALALLLASSTVALAAPSQPAPTPRSVYRFDVAITKDGIAAATYTLILQESDSGSLEAAADREKLGMHFKFDLRGAVVVLAGGVDLELTDPAPTTTKPAATTVRRMRADGAMAVTPGTPALFASMYDLASKHRYEVTVSAQRLL